MDIYSILASKPHNPHYLNRYITFIERCQLKNADYDGYMEKHHICPKANDMFPEYSSFSKNPWNKVNLTARQHFIAHLILWKVYRNKSCATTLSCFMKNNCKNSKIYESAKNLYSFEVSKRMKNMVVVKDAAGNIFHVNNKDERYTSGFLESITKNKVVVKDKNGTILKIDKDDIRYVSGEFVGIMKGTKGRKWSEKSKEKIRGNKNIGFRGKQHSIDSRNKTSKSLKGKKKNQIVVECPHCGKIGKGPNMTRYHFNNCKFIP